MVLFYDYGYKNVTVKGISNMDIVWQKRMEEAYMGNNT